MGAPGGRVGRIEGDGGSARPAIVAVVGGAVATSEEYEQARRLGAALASHGLLVLTGGRGGVMEGASRGAAEAGGTVLAILPGDGPSTSPPNPFVTIPIYSGLGDARNALVVGNASVVVAIGGGFGTLSEIGLALKAERPVLLLASWKITPPHAAPGWNRLLSSVATVEEAIARVQKLIEAIPRA